MDITKAQKVVDETVGTKFVIHKTEDSEKYTFAYYKHRDYNYDDQRGRLIGVGPVVFIKETGEYKLLGSGEMVLGDYFDFNQDFKESSPLNFDEIMAKIIRHKYVNDDDVFELQLYWEGKFGASNLSLEYNRGLDFRNYLVVNSPNRDFLNFIKFCWTELRLPFEIQNEEKILLSRNVII